MSADVSANKMDPAARVYLSCVAIYFIGVAINAVSIPWIVEAKLDLDARFLGFAQAALILPMACLVVFGGKIADRFERRSLLSMCLGLMAIPPITLGLITLFGQLNYFFLILELLAIAVIASVLNPTRDAMLAGISKGDVQPLVAKVVGVQYGVQVVGFALAAFAEVVSIGFVLIAQGVIWALGSIVARRLPVDAPQDTAIPSAEQAPLSDKRFGPVFALAAFLGASGMGTMLVIVPLLVLRDYGGGASNLTFANIAFTVGTVVISAIVIRRGAVIRRPGRLAIGLSITMSAVIAATAMTDRISLLLPTLLVLGGTIAVISIVLTSLVQSWAPPDRRGRLLGMYNLAVLGGGPVGAAILGFVAYAHSTTAASLTAAGSLATIAVTLAFFSSLWRATIESA